MATTPSIILPPGDLSVKAVAYGYLGKKPPIELEKHIYGNTDPSSRTLKEQLIHLIAGKEATFYLNVGGDDGNCGSADQPWRTLAYAFDQIYAIQRMCPDHGHITLILQDGMYRDWQTYATLGKNYVYDAETPQEYNDGDTTFVPNYIANKLREITIVDVTIKAENQHKAVLDGGWGPELIKDNFFDGIAEAYWFHRPPWAPKWYEGAAAPHNGHAAYNTILGLVNCKNVTIDGLRIQNSIGIGIQIANEKYPGEGNPFSFCENITVRNCRIDWCHFGAIKCGWDQNTSTIEGNTITRGAFDYWINKKPEKDRKRVDLVDGSGIPLEDVYGNPAGLEDKGPTPGNATAVILWANNATIRNNVCAYSYGEIAPRPRSSGSDEGDGSLVEGNRFIGNSNNCYLEGITNTTVRNNLLVSYPEDLKGPSEPDEPSRFYRPHNVALGIANEKRNHWCKHSTTEDYDVCFSKPDFTVLAVDPPHHCDNLRVYNNLLLWGKVEFRSRYAREDENKNQLKYPLPITRLYFGHNTAVAGKHYGLDKDGKTVGTPLFVTYSDYNRNLQDDPEHGHEKINGILENNLWDASFSKSDFKLTVGEGAEGQEHVLRIRNNVFPKSATKGYLSKQEEFGNIYTDDQQLIKYEPDTIVVDGIETYFVYPPKTSLDNTKMDVQLEELIEKLDEFVAGFRLNGDSVAIDNASEAIQDACNTPVPFEKAHKKDYFGNSPVDIPEKGTSGVSLDIGAVEYIPPSGGR